MHKWEEKFQYWAQSPSQSELQRCENAENAVRNAINASAKLKSRNVKIFLQGSYRNRTNIRGESDVDVGVVCREVFFTDYPTGKSDTDFGNIEGSYPYSQFKNEVGEALVAYFGAAAVTRGNKAFDLKENGYHVEADIAPFFEHRRYSISGSYDEGVELRPDNNIPPKIINWPEQHYKNGNEKNNRTKRKYRGLVRVLKNLRNEMIEKGIPTAEPIIGFLSECLIWNLPDQHFFQQTYYESLREGIIYLFDNTKSDSTCDEWGEVSELKYLFRKQQKWNRTQANDFLRSAWNYVGYN